MARRIPPDTTTPDGLESAASVARPPWSNPSSSRPNSSPSKVRSAGVHTPHRQRREPPQRRLGRLEIVEAQPCVDVGGVAAEQQAGGGSHTATEPECDQARAAPRTGGRPGRSHRRRPRTRSGRPRRDPAGRVETVVRQRLDRAIGHLEAVVREHLVDPPRAGRHARSAPGTAPASRPRRPRGTAGRRTPRARRRGRSDRASRRRSPAGRPRARRSRAAADRSRWRCRPRGPRRALRTCHTLDSSIGVMPTPRAASRRRRRRRISHQRSATGNPSLTSDPRRAGTAPAPQAMRRRHRRVVRADVGQRHDVPLPHLGERVVLGKQVGSLVDVARERDVAGSARGGATEDREERDAIHEVLAEHVPAGVEPGRTWSPRGPPPLRPRPDEPRPASR